ncbi:hypothetical protein CJ030_MR8G002792 [Morella rubra]|uniref:DUF668 domain-containing protein n=1 Tax=Morella rubra TaxID=262757 RepID=A0A6A1UTH0_9ROSI|nr:hypothetical protein CJ030_MR8G002792 [Morella rubra]
MGGVCPGGMVKRNAKVGEKLKTINSFSKLKADCSPDSDADDFGKTRRKCESTERRKSFSSDSKPSTPNRSKASTPPPTLSKPSTPTRTSKIIQKRLGRAGEKAVDVLDTLGSRMSKLNGNSGFANGRASRGSKISMQEFEVFLQEVIRFGDMCKDPQLHKLGQYFSKLDSDGPSHKQLKVDTETTIQELITLAQQTSELYHELHAFDRFEQDYRRKIEEMESLSLPKGGDSLAIFHSELKEQRKLVTILKKKSLWSRNLEEIVKKLVDVVTCIHKAIWEAFENNGVTVVRQDASKGPQRLGETGLALHYANIINQINIIVKAEMERTLKWLVPVATNTIKAHQGFGWVGEWAKASIEFGKNSTTPSNLIRIQTLYYADKETTDQYILKLVTLLNHMISSIRHRDHGFKPQPVRSPTRTTLDFHSKMRHFVAMKCTSKTLETQLSQEDKNLLDEVIGSLTVPGINRSQELDSAKNRETRVLSSTGCSPARELGAKNDKKTDISGILTGTDLIA